MTYYRLVLPYHKQGDDLAYQLTEAHKTPEKNPVAAAFRAHAALLWVTSKILERMAVLAEVVDLDVQADTHMISLTAFNEEEPLFKQLVADPDFPLEEEEDEENEEDEEEEFSPLDP